MNLDKKCTKREFTPSGMTHLLENTNSIEESIRYTNYDNNANITSFPNNKSIACSNERPLQSKISNDFQNVSVKQRLVPCNDAGA